MPKVTCLANGPYLIEGDTEVFDATGRPFAVAKDKIALCRCGASRNKPFCDGSHKAFFRADDTAPRG